jgi:hypothetical protein
MTEINVIIDEEGIDEKDANIINLFSKSADSSRFIKLSRQESYIDLSKIIDNLSIIEISLKMLIELNEKNKTIIPLIEFSTAISGGKEIKKFKPIINTSQNKSNYNNISFNKRIRAVFKTKKQLVNYVIPAHESVKIVGLFIKHKTANICSIPPINGTLPDYIEIKNNEIIKFLLNNTILQKEFIVAEFKYCKNMHINYESPRTEIQPYTGFNIKPTRNNILVEFEKVINARFADNANTVMIADLIAFQLENAYYEYSPAIISKLQSSHELRKAQMLSKHNIISEQYKITKYKRIILQKLKIKITKHYSSIQALLNSLSPANQKLIKLEETKDAEYKRALLMNKCPHIKDLKALRDANTMFAISSASKNLTKYFADKHEFIKCNLCSFNLICEHELIINANLKLPADDLKQKMIDFYIQYNNSCVCKYCFEEIKEIMDPIEFMPELTEDYDSDIKDQIITEIYRLKKFILTVRVPFTQVRDIVFGGIYRDIYIINQQLNKSKTTSIHDIRRKLSLYIGIYISAYYLAIPEITIDGSTNDISLNIQKIAKKITSYYDVIIRENPDTNSIWVKQHIINVYKKIDKKSFVFDKVVKDEIVVRDYIYNYNSYLRKIFKLKKNTDIAKAYENPINGNKTFIEQSVNLFYDNMKIADKNQFIVIVDRKDNFTSEVSDVRKKIHNEYIAIRDVEDKIIYERSMLTAKPTSTRELKRFKDPIIAPLGRVYDINGNLHIYKFVKGVSTCEVCKLTRAEASKLDEKTIQKALIIKNNIIAFFQIFLNNCPLGGITMLIM